jgi:glucan biosynthesis protein C
MLVFNGSETAFESTLSNFSNLLIFIPQMTFHLWFLYYLALITYASVSLGLVFKKLPSVSSLISLSFSWVIEKPVLRILVFASLTSIVYFLMGTYEVATSPSLIPDLNTFIFYFFFYIIGWILFNFKHLLNTIMRLDLICTVLGLLLLSIHFFMYLSLSFEIHIIANSVIVWLLIFGITGLFIRYGSKHSSTMRYISDSSYWVYLVHLFLTAIIPSFIVEWPLPATIKFLFVLISTGIICFVSYHYLVRGTFIGKFLNGRKYSRKLSDIKKTEEMSQLQLEPILDK